MGTIDWYFMQNAKQVLEFVKGKRLLKFEETPTI